MQIAVRIAVLFVAIASPAPLDNLRAEPARTTVRSTAADEAVEPARASLAAIATWLSDRYQLPRAEDLPNIELVPASRLATLRYKGLLPEHWQSGANTEAQRRIVAVYDDARRTIYLPEGWTGATLAERSILVHEMVHHLQNLGGLKFECAGAREKLAYEAHDDWLKAHGSELEQEFQIDMFTVLALALCLN